MTLIGAGALFVVACGDSSGSGESSAAADTTTTSTATRATTVPSTTSAPRPTVIGAATSTSTSTLGSTTAPVTSTTLPGAPIDWLVSGTSAQVAGVAWNETFPIRALPGDGQPIAAELPPLTALVLTGLGREIDADGSPRVWAELQAAGATGWVSLWSLVYLGAPRDLTDQAIDLLGERPSAPTVLELAEEVVDAVAPIDPASAGARVVRATDPNSGSIDEVVYDVFPGEDLGDDAAAGARHRIVGRRLPSGRVELALVEARSLCTRGVDAASGACV